MHVDLDVNWPDDPKVIRVGLEGAGLHAMAMCMVGRSEPGFLVSRYQLTRLGATDELVDLLVQEGLLDPVEYGAKPGEDPSKAYTFRVLGWDRGEG